MLGGIIPGPEQLSKKAVMLAVTVPEGVIMLTLAVLFDVAGLFLFILSFFGVGEVVSIILDIVAGLIFGAWTATRYMFRGVIEKAVGNITNKMLNVGGGLEGIKKFQGDSAPGLQGSIGQKGIEEGKQVVKTGARLTISLVYFLISFAIKLIPFANDILPTWTIFVIFQLVQGEI